MFILNNRKKHVYQYYLYYVFVKHLSTDASIIRSSVAFFR